MNISLVLTTINKVNKNINTLSKQSKLKKWDLVIIGDKKTPKEFKLNYGKYLNIKSQLRTGFKFASICPLNSYARKNIGYLQAIKNNSDVIIETDDDNIPKKDFFKKIKLTHEAPIIKNKGWINIYEVFTKKKINIWPRGLPLDYANNKILKLSNKKFKKEFFLQQGVCEGNPDVDAIYRLLNKNINIKFKNNFKVNLSNSYSPFNSQNTIWFKKIFPLLYLPVTCTMRSTDIVRSLVCLKILKNDDKDILFYGTTMYQKRNYHNLDHDFKDEIYIYLNSKKILDVLTHLKLKKGENNYLENLMICYKSMIKKGFFDKLEIKYLNAWIYDVQKLFNN